MGREIVAALNGLRTAVHRAPIDRTGDIVHSEVADGIPTTDEAA